MIPRLKNIYEKEILPKLMTKLKFQKQTSSTKIN